MVSLFFFFFFRIKTLRIINEGPLNQPEKHKKRLMEYLPSKLTNEDV